MVCKVSPENIREVDCKYVYHEKVSVACSRDRSEPAESRVAVMRQAFKKPLGLSLWPRRFL